MCSHFNDILYHFPNPSARFQPRGPASRTIVLHPGSQYLRIGRATDLYPQSVPNVLARRKKLNAVEQGSANGANGASLMGQNGATAQPNDVEMRDANKDGKSNASPEKGDSSDLSEPSSENEKTQNGRADGPAVNKASSSNDDAAAGSNSDEEDETSEGEGKGSTKDLVSSHAVF